MIAHPQKGVSLIITFLIMTIILATILSISTILVNELNIIRGIGSSTLSFFAADTGVEKTLYYDRKQVTVGANRGLCNMPITCANTTNDCSNFTNTGSDCAPLHCTNCQITYDSTLPGNTKKYTVTVSITPDSTNTYLSHVDINSKGLYDNIVREINNNNTDTVNCPVAFYRYYSPSGIDHFYTATYGGAYQFDYQYQKIAGYIFTYPAAGTIPLFRYYYSSPGFDHFYTTDQGELGVGGNANYQAEGTIGYVFSSQVSGTLPFYRYYYASPGIDHFYTTDQSDPELTANYHSEAPNTGYILTAPPAGCSP